MRLEGVVRSFVTVVLLIVLSACSASAGRGSVVNGFLPAYRVQPDSSPIKHIVIIVQENRSFENIFAGFPHAYAPTYGYNHKGVKVPLHEMYFKTGVGVDIGHDYHQALTEWNNGKMNGFDEDQFNNGKPAGTYPYAFISRKQVQPYWDMASQYTLADHMFPTVWGPSFTAHLDLIAGTTVYYNFARHDQERDRYAVQPKDSQLDVRCKAAASDVHPDA